jgi:hypothetical protein
VQKRTGDDWNYVAAATAALEAWLAWRDQRAEQVVAFGTEALEIWTSQLPPYRLKARLMIERSRTAS